MCDDLSKPNSEEQHRSPTLAMYQSSHEAVARYRVILRPNFSDDCQIVGNDLRYGEAKEMCDTLNANRIRVSFGGPVYGIKLENPDESLEAVRLASKHWAR